MQTGCIPLKRIRKSNSSWKRKADMDEKPMKAINIVDKKTTKIKAPDVEIKIDVEHRACGHFFRPLCLYSFYNLED